jgi:hypothetical protein
MKKVGSRYGKNFIEPAGAASKMLTTVSFSRAYSFRAYSYSTPARESA